MGVDIFQNTLGCKMTKGTTTKRGVRLGNAVSILLATAKNNYGMQYYVRTPEPWQSQGNKRKPKQR